MADRKANNINKMLMMTIFLHTQIQSAKRDTFSSISGQFIRQVALNLNFLATRCVCMHKTTSQATNILRCAFEKMKHDGQFNPGSSCCFWVRHHQRRRKSSYMSVYVHQCTLEEMRHISSSSWVYIENESYTERLFIKPSETREKKNLQNIIAQSRFWLDLV